MKPARWLVLALALLMLWPLRGGIAGELLLEDTVLVRFPDGMEGKAESLGRAFLRKRAEFEDYFAIDPPRPTVMQLCGSTAAFHEAVGHSLPASVAAVALGGANRIVVNLPASEGPLRLQVENVIGHEILHLFYWEFGRRAAEVNPSLHPNEPVWFNEGIASWMEGMDVQVNNEALLVATAQDKLIDLKDLWHDFPNGEQEMHLAYAMSKSFVSFLDKQTTDRTMVRILNAYAVTGDFEEAIRSVTGRRLVDLFHEWKASQPKMIAPWARWFETPYLFLAAALMVILAWARTRRRNREIVASWDDFDEDPEPRRGARRRRRRRRDDGSNVVNFDDYTWAEDDDFLHDWDEEW